MWRDALLGVAFSLGAPLGWLGLRFASQPGLSLPEELSTHSGLYAYLLVGTGLAFAAFGAVLGLMADRLAQAGRRFEEAALTDVLTGLRNQRYFQERLEAECARAERDGKPLSLISADLDLFKQVNDSCGHPYGDQVLQHAARIIQQSARLGDVCCRVGGEEFSIICPGASGDDAARIAERIRRALEVTPLPTHPHSPGRVTASLGVSSREPGERSESLLGQADGALYQAKRNGRNQVRVAKAASDLAQSLRAP